MEFTSLNVQKIHILRIDPGEDVLLMVRKFLAESGLRQAVVMSGYGTLAAYSLHWVEHNHIPTHNLFRKGEGGIEILAMNGLVVDGKPHIHVALSNPPGGLAGTWKRAASLTCCARFSSPRCAGPSWLTSACRWRWRTWAAAKFRG